MSVQAAIVIAGFVKQGGRTLSRHRLRTAARRTGRRTARRDHVELVAHRRDGRIRDKESYGKEGATPDTERWCTKSGGQTTALTSVLRSRRR